MADDSLAWLYLNRMLMSRAIESEFEFLPSSQLYRVGMDHVGRPAASVHRCEISHFEGQHFRNVGLGFGLSRTDIRKGLDQMRPVP